MQRVGASSSSVATSFVMVEPDESLASRSSSSGVAARRSGSATDQIEEVEYVEEEVEEEVEVEEEEELDEQAAAVQDPAASTTSGGNQERTKSATISQPVTEDTKRSSNEAATQPPAPANKQPQPTTDEITPSTTAEEATLDKPGAATSRPAPAQAAGDDAFAAFGNFEASFISKMQALRSTVTSTLHHLADSTPDTASAARSDGAAAAAPQQQAASGSSAAFSTSITKQLGGLTSGLGELASSWWGAAAVGVAGGSGADNVARPQEELQAQFGISDTEQVVDAFRCKLVQTYACSHNTFTPPQRLTFPGLLHITDHHLLFGSEGGRGQTHVKLPLADIRACSRQAGGKGQPSANDTLRLELNCATAEEPGSSSPMEGQYLAFGEFEGGGSALDSALALIEHLTSSDDA